jgi:GDPmannose 4,6-dehydratase
MMQRSLILGVNGQDGQIMTENLLSLGDQVYGLGRQEFFAQEKFKDKINYYQVDLIDQDRLKSLLVKINPTRIFHFAAVHGSAQNNIYEQVYSVMLDVNVKTVHTILEYLRGNLSCQLIYASSGKVFGNPLPDVVSEVTPQNGSCLYSISKITAGNLIDYYRLKHDVKAAIYYFFNHESPLRGGDFFIRKISIALRASIQDKSHKTNFQSLNFYCDWGDAYEYMNLTRIASELAPSEDLVIASGHSTHARKLVYELFHNYGLDYINHVEESDSLSMQNKSYKVDITKLKKIAKAPEITVKNVVIGMI